MVAPQLALPIRLRYSLAEEPKQENKLLGTWKLVSANIPEGCTQLKHV
jgi:hypothetical protein